MFNYRLADIPFKDTFDLLESRLEELNIVKMTNEDIESFISFFCRNKNVSEMVIHCSAGVSRSPSIGIVVCWLLKNQTLEDELLDSIKDTTLPNSYILNKFARYLGVKRKYLNFHNEDEFDTYLEHLFGNKKDN